MSAFNEDYDPGFLNVPGFGQSVTNPLQPVFYDSLGVVKNLTVYQSIYCAKEIRAGLSISVGNSKITGKSAQFSPEVNFLDNVKMDKDLSVGNTVETERVRIKGKDYLPTTIVTQNGSFLVLAAHCNDYETTLCSVQQ